MGDHWFLDESKRDQYVMVAATVDPKVIPPLRQAVRSARVPGTRRLHFRAERDEVRKRFLAVLTARSVRARVYVAGGRTDLAARESLLTQIVRDAVSDGAARLVLERDDSVLAHDLRVVKRERARLEATDDLRYDALPAVAEPLLWIPDAVAWAWCRSDDWRRRVRPIVSSVVEV